MIARRMKAEGKKVKRDIYRGELIGVFPIQSVAYKMSEEDFTYCWQFELEGPACSPYEDGLFRVEFQFPPEYPFKAPKIKFLNDIWHPKFVKDDYFCLTSLKKWKPVYNVEYLLNLILKFLKFPELKDCCIINSEAAEELKDNDEFFFEKAKSWTQLYAKFD